MNRTHSYQSNLIWTGNTGLGTSGYQNYARDYTIQINGKVDMAGSADAAFRGDASKHNPEELLLMALSSCHMLWYLHLCADAGVIVTTYQDQARRHHAGTSQWHGQIHRSDFTSPCNSER
jgi:organic hydroperoxide reductase OsmC/OhrA